MGTIFYIMGVVVGVGVTIVVVVAVIVVVESSVSFLWYISSINFFRFGSFPFTVSCKCHIPSLSDYQFDDNTCLLMRFSISQGDLDLLDLSFRLGLCNSTRINGHHQFKCFANYDSSRYGCSCWDFISTAIVAVGCYCAFQEHSDLSATSFLMGSDEAAHKELGDIIERVATTASSLEAEQDSGNID
ncbi:hypothetical protein Tco_0195401 [Tanacetum coccineum]